MKGVNGFTLLELIVVISLISLMTIFAFPFISGSVGRSQLQSTGWEVQDLLRRAQAQSMSGKGNTQWGVHFETNTFSLFAGATYNALDPDTIIYDFPYSIQMQSITVNGGGNDIIFTRSKGKTSNFGDVIILDTSSNTTVTISVSKEGKIDS